MLIWKGIEFRTKGIIVEKTPIITKGEKRIDIYDIPGRSGFLSVDEGTYNSIVISVECHSEEGANFNDIASFLDGYGTLSFDGQKEYIAIVKNSIPFEKVQMFKSFVIEFLVNPICYDIGYSSFDVAEPNSILTIDRSYYEITPIITIECSGDVSITINNKTFHLYDTDGEYILDSNLKIITNNGINASNNMQGDFALLQVGDNQISFIGNVSSFNIKYKRTYLVGV